MTLTVALIICVLYLAAYFVILTPSPKSMLPAASTLISPLVPKDESYEASESGGRGPVRKLSYTTVRLSISSRSSIGLDETPPPPDELSFRARFKIMRSIWPYTIPLFLVYASEYMLQVMGIALTYDDMKTLRYASNILYTWYIDCRPVCGQPSGSQSSLNRRGRSSTSTPTGSTRLVRVWLVVGRGGQLLRMT